jgi:hypothetical protein
MKRRNQALITTSCSDLPKIIVLILGASNFFCNIIRFSVILTVRLCMTFRTTDTIELKLAAAA